MGRGGEGRNRTGEVVVRQGTARQRESRVEEVGIQAQIWNTSQTNSGKEESGKEGVEGRDVFSS